MRRIPFLCARRRGREFDLLFTKSNIRGPRVGREAAFEFFGDGDGFEGLATDGDEDEVSVGDHLVAAVAAHLEVEP
jgi:hypothetical protein